MGDWNYNSDTEAQALVSDPTEWRPGVQVLALIASKVNFS
jgi:hypothetical protein